MGSGGWFTVVIASLGAMIAYFQFVTARRKLMLDLFDRRMKVVEGVEQALAMAVTRGVTDEHFIDFVRAQAAARFIFGEDVVNLLRRIQKDFAFLRAYTDDVLSNPSLHNRDVLIDKKLRIQTRLPNYPDELIASFGPYMKFTEKQTKAWLPW